MDADELALFTGGADADRLAALREQVWLLARVREEMRLQGQILHALVTGTPGYHWRSVAERGYAARLTELAADLEHAGRFVDAACSAVREELERRSRVE